LAVQLIPFSFVEFEDRFLEKKAEVENNVSILLIQHLEDRTAELEADGKISSASINNVTMKILKAFMEKTRGYNANKITLAEVDYTFIVKLVKYLENDRKIAGTTISIYLRCLRAILNRAIKAKLISRDTYPFYDFQISKIKTTTKKRAIAKELVHKIAELKFVDTSKAQFAQHIFLFSYYTRGMNFIDIAGLTGASIVGDRINYTRSKTKGEFSIKINSKTKEILDFYDASNKGKTDYLFPIFDKEVHITDQQKYNRKKKVLKQVNKELKEIATLIGLEGLKLTTYVSRHSYATTLKNGNVPTAQISEALGHSTEKTTQTYLKSFDKDVLDEIDERVL